MRAAGQAHPTILAQFRRSDDVLFCRQKWWPTFIISSAMDDNRSLRQHIINLLTEGESHLDPRTVLEQFPHELCGHKPPGAPHSAWELLEHLRIAQWDILQFTLDPNHISPKWPDECWPATDTPTTAGAWDESVKHFLADLDSIQQLICNPETNLMARIPHGTGQTFLREALLVADHNAYHLGQLVMLRRVLERK